MPRCRICDRIDSPYRSEWSDFYCSECYNISRKAANDEDFTLDDLYDIMGESGDDIDFISLIWGGKVQRGKK